MENKLELCIFSQTSLVFTFEQITAHYKYYFKNYVSKTFQFLSKCSHDLVMAHTGKYSPAFVISAIVASR